MIRYLLIGLFAYLFIGLFLAPAWAQTMSNKDYIINIDDLNAGSSVTDTNYKPKSLPKELNPSISEGVNFKVKAGFENIIPTLPFSVSLSSDLIDFGTLSPTNPIIRTVDLSVDSLSTLGYSVIASEDHPLQSNPEASGANIPDTTCDNGECSVENSAEWINTLTYGLGYRCDNITGLDCDTSFSKPNFYKSFANNESEQPPQSVMAGIGSKNKNIRLSYKVNISGNQAQGIYANTVTYIAVPNF